MFTSLIADLRYGAALESVDFLDTTCHELTNSEIKAALANALIRIHHLQGQVENLSARLEKLEGEA